MHEAFYGLSLCLFKLNKFIEALHNVEHAISLSKEQHKHYKYLRAICCKYLGRFEEAEEIYIELFPFKKGKCKVNCKLLNKYYIAGDGWKVDKLHEIITILEDTPFFNRFNASELEQIIKMMKVKDFSENNLMFLNKEEVTVILQGHIMLYSRALDLNEVQIITKYQVGDIIGHCLSDNGISRNPEYWLYAKTECELCIFEMRDFEVVWHMQMFPTMVKKMNRIKEFGLFKDITPQTLCLIIYELKKRREVDEGVRVCRMLNRSIFKTETVKGNQIKTSNTSLQDIASVYNTSNTFLQKINRKLQEECDGLYLILEGKCQVRNVKHVVDTLQVKDYFGASEFFEEIGYSYFGDIITREKCTFAFISKEDMKRIPEYDKAIIRDNNLKNKSRITKLLFQCTAIYGGNPYEIKY